MTAVLLILSFAFIMVFPLWALGQAWTVSEKASPIQASTSWVASVVAIAALLIALFAYWNSVQKPKLVMLYQLNEGAVLELTLLNEGGAGARNVLVNVRPLGLVLQGGRPVWQDHAGTYIFGTSYERLLHPGATWNLRPFSLVPAAAGHEAPSLTVGWTCDGSPCIEERLRVKVEP